MVQVAADLVVVVVVVDAAAAASAAVVIDVIEEKVLFVLEVEEGLHLELLLH